MSQYSFIAMALLIPLFYVCGLLAIKAGLILVLLGVFQLISLIYLFKSKRLHFKVNLEFNMLFLLYNLFVLAFIHTTRKSIVAPLHDPAALSLLVSKLRYDFLDFSVLPKKLSHYPIGSALLLSPIAKLSGTNGAGVVLYFTNVFQFLTALSMGSLLKEITRSRAALYIGTLAFLAYSGTLYLYFRAGKNAQIIGFFFFMMTLSFIIKYLRKAKIHDLVIACFGGFSAIIVHYNNIFFLLSYGLVFLAAFYTYKSFKNKKTMYWLQCAGVLGLSLSLALAHYFYIKNLGSELVSSFTNPENHTTLLSQWDLFTGHFQKNGFFHLKNSSFHAYLFLRDNWQYLLYLLPLTGIFLKNRAIVLLTIIPFIHEAVVNDFFSFLGQSYIDPHFASVYSNICIIFMACLSVTALLKLLKWKPLSILFILTLSIHTYLIIQDDIIMGYKNATGLSLVRQDDLKAFKWIKNNTERDKYFIPGNISITRTAFIGDASVYLYQMTGRQELLSFTGNEKFFRQDKEYLPYLRRLGNDPRNKEALSYLLDMGVKYVFVGSVTPFGRGILDTPHILDTNPDIYKLRFSSGRSRVYEIVM